MHLDGGAPESVVRYTDGRKCEESDTSTITIFTVQYNCGYVIRYVFALT